MSIWPTHCVRFVVQQILLQTFKLKVQRFYPGHLVSEVGWPYIQAGSVQMILMQILGLHPEGPYINVPYNRNLLLGPTPDREVSALRMES